MLIKECHPEKLTEIIGFYALCITVFLMPFPSSWSLYALGISLMAGFTLWILNFRSYVRIFKSDALLLLSSVVYFLLHVIWFFAGDLRWKNIEGYLMFILVPLFGFPMFRSEYFTRNRYIFLKGFIYGILFICIFEYIRALSDYLFNIGYSYDASFDPDNYSSIFRSFRLSFLEHPTYLSMKVLFALTIIILFKKEIKIRMAIIVPIMTLFVIYIYCLSSRTGLVTLIILSIYLTLKILKLKKRFYLMLLLVPLALYGTYRLAITNPRIENKTHEILRKYREETIKFKDIDPRFISWFTSADLIKKHPVTGVGLNSRDLLTAEYVKNGNVDAAHYRLNAHNQFLETQLALGIPGSLVLLWMLFAPLFRKRLLWNQTLYYSFIIILITAFLFESVLVRQWGIMFYTVFYCFQVTARKDPDQQLQNETAISQKR